VQARASFEVEVTPADAIAFANLSGDWNPLHTDAAHAAATAYKVPVLHGAYSAGLLSRLAGMHLPGRDCLLHDLKLRFLKPVLPPVKLRVDGEVTRDDGATGEVRARIVDARSGETYAEGSYGFGRHVTTAPVAKPPSSDRANQYARVAVTGASGGIGAAVMEKLNGEAVALGRGTMLDETVRLSAIVHCGWPAPDNTPLLEIGAPDSAVEHHVAAPLKDCLSLARLLARQGEPGAMLILLGSAFAEPGRHGYRTPLYSLAKGLLPPLTRALALELAAHEMRVATLVLDVIDGGMNAAVSPAVKQAHADRVPFGELPGPAEVAAQVDWLLANRGRLLSGAVVTLSGGALP
jgi:acyl dehydratase/NAD(P)-dependent dehydrogenase (short-subunit alcohol dehydrogenase family)